MADRSGADTRIDDETPRAASVEAEVHNTASADAGNRDPGAGRARRGLTPATRRWLLVAALLLLYSASITNLDRYFEWDEAVFYAQSGPVWDGRGNAIHYGPSRELGTAWLIAAIRVLPVDIPGARFAWMAVVMLLVMASFREIGRRGPRWSGEAGALLFGTFWITTAFSGAFVGSLVGALFALLSTAMYLRVQHEPDDRTAVFLGLALAGAFYMRTVETVLVVAVLVAHSLLWRRAHFWLRRRREAVVAAATFTAGFVVPWLIHSTVEYGSPIGHALAWIGRRTGANAAAAQERFPLELHNGAGEWFNIFRGQPANGGVPPGWSGRVVGAVLLIGLVAVVATLAVRALHRAREADEPVLHLGLLSVLAAVSFGLFFFVIVINKNRYAMYGAVFAAAVAGLLLGRLFERFDLRRLPLAAGVLLVGVVWLVANATETLQWDRQRTAATAGDAAAARLITATAAGEPCVVLFPDLPRPQITIASPCEIRGKPHYGDRMNSVARELAAGDKLPLVVWPRSRGKWPLAGEWELVERFSLSTSRRTNTRLYRPPE